MVERSTCWSRLGVSVAGAAMVSSDFSGVLCAGSLAKRKQRARLGVAEGGGTWEIWEAESKKK